ncbi:MAG: 16S rRNA (adenine(1518)-N(6)/adenine(1519)-N(6))-dimethyltransferase RsmA [Candidatus Aminicenantes bacterium]|nr:16S rRNA (adenine(1518)-N(6)/adenine(1519)-N(6))-dimethyltransferase RsmA [Candidatus Aminicenantes bacterium]
MKRGRRKRLGQHFLKNRHVLKKIIQRISPDKDELIIEIGAGRGVLTFPLAEKAGKVIAIEKDLSLIMFLQKKKVSNVMIIGKDVLKVDFDEMIKKEKNFKEVKIVGNLPYSISSPLLFKLFESKKLFSECLFLLQKEVAERICSHPGSKVYSPLTILFQVHFLTKLHFVVPPRCFSPPQSLFGPDFSQEKRVVSFSV